MSSPPAGVPETATSKRALIDVVCECSWCETGLSVYCVGPFTRVSTRTESAHASRLAVGTPLFGGTDDNIASVTRNGSPFLAAMIAPLAEAFLAMA